MKKIQLRNLIKEQLKQVKQDLSREKVRVAPLPFRGGKGGGKDPQQADRKKFINTDVSNLPSTYNSSATIAFYVCAMIDQPHGYGNGCYGISPQGTWTSPLTGATASNIGCLPWHQGGNCYGANYTSDFPIQTQNGPITSPPEQPCSPNCLHT